MGFHNWLLLFYFSDGTDEAFISSDEKIMMNAIAACAVKLFYILVKVQISFLSRTQLQQYPHPVMHDKIVVKGREIISTRNLSSYTNKLSYSDLTWNNSDIPEKLFMTILYSSGAFCLVGVFLLCFDVC